MKPCHPKKIGHLLHGRRNSVDNKDDQEDGAGLCDCTQRAQVDTSQVDKSYRSYRCSHRFMEELTLSGSQLVRTGKSVDHCGYCKTDASSICEGMLALSLNVMDYQNLIDHGWRRSGRYVYKPINKKTCCPMYTIRCEISSFHLSKSHKKVLRNMNKYLLKGKPVQSLSETKRKEWNKYLANPIGELPAPHSMSDFYDNEDASSRSPAEHNERGKSRVNAERRKTDSLSEEFSSRKGSFVDSAVSNDGTHRKKAKVIRHENKVNKLLSQGYSEKEIHERLKTSKVVPQVSSNLEDYMSKLESGTNKLLIKLVRTSPKSKEYRETERESFQLYRKYQIVIHGDEPNEVTKSGFVGFLVDSPLEPVGSENDPSSSYGSFHQQYWINGTLIAVGVIDILPYCVSSVYFYYDPDFKVLSLGTYGALSEIFFTKNLKLANPMIQFYYMGYYIHSCPKMRYKGSFPPSFLLCPENYTWHPIERCLPKLDLSKYSRFHEEIRADGSELIRG
ncbi:hypothetical protein J437_LFUL007629 [Ladona fulva]|uniref:Arginyl-tRNA--protein transferase 1 n=1 Tax=Ladona fulva TaxID=123851 RepID=A0A8K0P0V1_LADFU|nr:hypothetical protein J437_LFUL007629 [Ladona fulva]